MLAAMAVIAQKHSVLLLLAAEVVTTGKLMQELIAKPGETHTHATRAACINPARSP